MFKLCVVNLMHTSFQATKLQPNPKSELCVLTDTFRCVSSLTMHTSLHCGPIHTVSTSINNLSHPHHCCSRCYMSTCLLREYIPYCCSIMSLGCLLMYITVGQSAHQLDTILPLTTLSLCQDHLWTVNQSCSTLSVLKPVTAPNCSQYKHAHLLAYNKSVPKGLLSN